MGNLSCIAVALLVVLAPVANADALYKCVAANGAVSIQSGHCPAATKQVWRRDATPEPALTPEKITANAAHQQQIDADARTLSQLVDAVPENPPPAAEPIVPQAAASTPEPVKDACDLAKDFALSVREKAWLELTEQQQQRLFGWVAQQCKPAPSDQP